MFSIVIPIYNEADNIELLVNEIHNELNQSKYNEFEIIIVNDSSTDNTLKKINNLKKKFKIFLINNDINMGQSYSINKGIIHSNYETIVTIDGDGQNNPIDIPKLLDQYYIKDNVSLVGGLRKKRKDNIIKIISSIIANKIRSTIFNDGCDDTGCSLKVFDKKVFIEFPYFNGIHRFLPALFVGFGYKTFFIEVDHRARIKGHSKYGTLDRLYLGIIDIIRVKNIINKKKNK